MYDVGEAIHTYNFPLGEQRWLVCAYLRRADGYVWEFRHGGDLAPVHWPKIIAQGLSGLARFGNHTQRPYSVLRHSYLLGKYVREVLKMPPAAVLLALIHDAPECLGAGDMNTFLKKQVGRAISSYEADLIDFLGGDMTFGRVLIEDEAERVHKVDQVFGTAEARLLGMDNGIPWLVRDDDPIYLWLQADGLYDTTPAASQAEWLTLFSEAWYDLLCSLAPAV